MKSKIRLIWIPVIITLIGGLMGSAIGWQSPEPVRRDILVKARRYAYNPEKIIVNKGDTLHIKLVSLDVTHGFFLEGYDLDARVSSGVKKFKYRHPSEGYNWKETDELVIIVDRKGKFRYRCSQTCGTMHPFMNGEMIVQPNTPYHASVGGIIGFFIGMILMFISKSNGKKDIKSQISEYGNDK